MFECFLETLPLYFNQNDQKYDSKIRMADIYKIAADNFQFQSILPVDRHFENFRHVGKVCFDHFVSVIMARRFQKALKH
jgi:hypothetical protein